jgi:hypothetical protein
MERIGLGRAYMLKKRGGLLVHELNIGYKLRAIPIAAEVWACIFPPGLSAFMSGFSLVEIRKTH